MNNQMDSQVKAARIQAHAVIIAAVISGILNILSFNYIGTLSENADTLNAKNTELSKQLIELQSQLANSQNTYSDLQKQYSDLEGQNIQLSQAYAELEFKYQKLLSDTGQSDTPAKPVGGITKSCWLDQMDVFFFEGKHISGSTSDGWCRNWDSTLQKDSLGAEHNHGICVRGYREDISIIDYIPDDTYTGLKGAFTLEYESKNVQIESYAKFYSINSEQEKTLLYAIEQPLSGGIPPIPFDFPVNGADHLRIEISSGTGNSGEFILALVDACFYK